jgi:mRNA interferase RelE/StbE
LEEAGSGVQAPFWPGIDDLSRIDRAPEDHQGLLILAENPEALKNNIKRLKGDLEGLYRLRVGRYRIVFRKNGKELVILIVDRLQRHHLYQILNGRGRAST